MRGERSRPFRPSVPAESRPLKAAPPRRGEDLPGALEGAMVLLVFHAEGDGVVGVHDEPPSDCMGDLSSPTRGGVAVPLHRLVRCRFVPSARVGKRSRNSDSPPRRRSVRKGADEAVDRAARESGRKTASPGSPHVLRRTRDSPPRNPRMPSSVPPRSSPETSPHPEALGPLRGRSPLRHQVFFQRTSEWTSAANCAGLRCVRGGSRCTTEGRMKG